MRMRILKWSILVGGVSLVCFGFQFLRYGDGYWQKGQLDSKQSAVAAQITQAEKIASEGPTFSKETPELILSNKKVLLARTYEPNDLTLVQGVYLREMAAVALARMLAGAEQEGITGLVTFSGYRSYATQASVYANKIASLRPKYGDDAEEMAQRLVAPPGSSEHQTGLAVDITLKKFLHYEYVLNYDFADTEQGQWLSKNSWKYGFILRYAENKEDKTNYSYEPWHFRYVGVEHAQRMYELDLCLEEYISRFGK